MARSEYSKESVPTLEQVFAILKNTRAKDPVVYVELKIDKGQEYRLLVQSVAELISNRKLFRQTVIISFNLKAVTLMKEVNPSIRTGALFEPRRNAHRVVRKYPMIKAALDCGASEILLHRLLATRRMAQAARKADLVPVVWTVDDPKWIERAQSYGIHAIMTNHPATMSTQPTK
jgi:glycerophosphoryl diester phosphodiesterase